MEGFQHRSRGLVVMRLSGGQDEIDRPAFGIDERMDFGGEPATGTSHAAIAKAPLFAVAACWWTRTQELSIMMISLSKALETAARSRSQTPALRHRTNRL